MREKNRQIKRGLILLGVLLALSGAQAGFSQVVSAEGTEVTPPSAEALEDWVKRAEEAADRAWSSAQAADRARQERLAKEHMDPRGFYLGGAFFYAAENFDDRIIVKSSTGGAGLVGYRFGSFVATELRYEGFEGFDLRGPAGRGVLDGSALTIGAKVYPFRGEIQPYVGVGLGAVFFEQKLVFGDGSRARTEDADFAFRFAAGADVWLTNHLTLNLEAAYLAPADELSNLEMTILSTGLTYHF